MRAMCGAVFASAKLPSIVVINIITIVGIVSVVRVVERMHVVIMVRHVVSVVHRGVGASVWVL